MTEIPDEDSTRGDKDAAARNSLAGDTVREIDPDVDELNDINDGNGGTKPETGD